MADSHRLIVRSTIRTTIAARYHAHQMSDFIRQTMQEALRKHQAGAAVDAMALYTQVLKRDPGHSQAMRLMGVALRQAGEIEEAIEFLTLAIKADPRSPEAHNNFGDALRSAGRLIDAIASYRMAVELKSDWAEGWGALGNALRENGDYSAAEAAFMRAARIKPSLAMARVGLGNVYCDQSKIDEAIAQYQAAIEIDPMLPQAHNNLGNMLWEQRKLNPAMAAYRKAISLRPAYVEPQVSLGKILLAQGRHEPALECFMTAVHLNPKNATAHFYLARALAKVGRRDDAVRAYQAALQLNPDAPDWRYELAALTGDGSVKTTPRGYVRALFDGYAANFDRELVDKLEYRTPERLLEAVKDALDQEAGNLKDKPRLSILDLGCGTGLCGVQFKPLAKHLAGVDLSPLMIEAARGRGIYDRLEAADLLSALSISASQYDLIVAGDVLNYVGDLSELMPAALHASSANGLFAFSIEHHPGEGFLLQASERFAHSIGYVRQIASAAGWIEQSARHVALRKESGGDVIGWIVVLAKPSNG